MLPFSGVKLPSTCFKDAPDAPDDALDRRFPNDDVYSIRAPLTMPLLKGVDILEGSSTDPNVMESVEDYHIAVGAWACIMKTVLDDNNRLANPDIMLGLGANCFAPAPADINFVSDPKIGLSMIIKRIPFGIQPTKGSSRFAMLIFNVTFVRTQKNSLSMFLLSRRPLPRLPKSKRPFLTASIPEL